MGRRILADAGYDVITVNNGSAALKKIAEQKPDLIVLDVYMPGYGGLEVCQRLKENYETASIPVLLSVGKLEPFKADEANKVQADAFIVKPFEASELLTALTKLEDKIKPQASAQKHGRFGKTEQAGERFGDKETGWKYRLIIPALTDSVLQQEAELEHPKAEVVAQAELKTAEPVQDLKPTEPVKVSDSAIPAGLPIDITPDEIAALAAAAAAFSPKEETKIEVAAQVDELPAPMIAQAEPVPDQVAAEIPSATFAADADVQPSTEPVAQIDAPASQPEAAPEAQQAPEAPVPEVETAKPATTEAAANVDERREDTPDVGKWGKDADVLAALASLLPLSDAAQASGTSATAGNPEDIPTSIAVAASATTDSVPEYIGPRWMAEPVPLMEEETTLLLEQEMEKAFAAFAAAEAARMNAAAEAPLADVIAHSEIAHSVPSPELAGPVEVTVSTAVVSTEATAQVQEVAYAAAASVSSRTEANAPAETSSTLPVSAASLAAVPATEEEVDRHTEAELAAAWQNWKQIRETIISSNIVGSELTSQIAGVAAAELRIVQQEPSSIDEPDEATAESAETDSDVGDAEGPAAIASIVDSVLAELKPKLIAEIARKMKQEKKGKQKKGKK
jgi:CheY-like chemotaxis protein